MAAAPMPPWIDRQRRQLRGQQGHAVLLQGPSGLGQFDLALALARDWLCLEPVADGGACGQCTSCHGLTTHAHPDLRVLMPEQWLIDLDWPLDEKAQRELVEEKKRKPSRDIRVDAVRGLIEFLQRTSAQGRGLVAILHPADAMNAVSANALLKTLEEPVGNARIILCSGAAQSLPPTVRSRCLAHTMAWPDESQAMDWLKTCGVPADDAAFLLRYAGGRPFDALRWHQRGFGSAVIGAWPAAVKSQNAQAFGAATLADQFGFYQRLCHDLLTVCCGGEPRYFGADRLPRSSAGVGTLSAWARELARAAIHIEHPYQASLAAEALVSRAHAVVHSRP